MSDTTRVCFACRGYGLLDSGDGIHFAECSTCGGRGYFVVTFSELAPTPKTRARVRGQARFRRGYALSARGQQRVAHEQQYKQRRPNAEE